MWETFSVWKSQKLYASRNKLLIGVLHIVTSEGAVEEGPD